MVLTTQSLTPDVYWVQSGAGSGNTGIIVGDKGVIVIDTTRSPEGGKKLQAEVAKITPKPITTVILTHADGDHVGGLSTFPIGITIIGQENCKKILEDGIASGHSDITADYLPNHTVDKREDTTINGVKFDLLHWAPAHTTADLAIYLPEQKLVFTGDLIVLDQPHAALIKRNLHATSTGWIESAKGLLALDADRYVVGHGDEVQSKQQIEQRVNEVIAERDKIKELVGKGEALQQIQTEVGDPPPNQPKPAPGARVFMPLSEVIYRELIDDGSVQNLSGEQLWQKFMDARNTTHDKQAAIDYLKKAADLGNAKAQAQLGTEYRGGDFELVGILPIDLKKSYELTKLAVDQGNASAMTDMGSLYMRGMGVEKDYAEALKWFLKGTEGGDRKAPRYVGVSYENGYGTAVDYKKAEQYYRKSADTEDITGQCLLGSLYERGLAVQQSYDQAIDLYTKSAARGDKVASAGMAALGNLWETRTDGKQDLQTAIDWYKKAADQGNADAKADLERLTASNPRPVQAGRNLCLAIFGQ